MNNVSEVYYKSIDKQLLMGVAITLVWLYHMRCTCHVGNYVFGPGFIGVDIFFFLSGYGLCYSINKNSLKKFYANRVKRVYPLFCILAVFYTAMRLFLGLPVSIWDWFCNIFSLSYYKIGGQYISWYLSVQLLLYLLFPLIYRLSVKFGVVAVLLSQIFSVAILSINDWHWRYDCFFSRTPIFMLGVSWTR